VQAPPLPELRRRIDAEFNRMEAVLASGTLPVRVLLSSRINRLVAANRRLPHGRPIGLSSSPAGPCSSKRAFHAHSVCMLIPTSGAAARCAPSTIRSNPEPDRSFAVRGVRAWDRDSILRSFWY
jgi:hypothetical protein